jgi:CubicO group peptidase (beta-lactamase class C family)
VVLYDAAGKAVRDDNHGARPDCPIVPARDGNCDLERWQPGVNGATFSPQGGARVSMRDLARIGRLLTGDGVVDGIRLLSPASVAAMRAPSWRYDGANGDSEGGFYCAYGLATQLLGLVPGCNDDLFGDGRPRFGHAGEAYGVRSGLWVDAAAGTGVAFFASGVPADASRGSSAYTAVEERMARGGQR